MIIVHELVEELESYPDTTRLGRAQIDAIMALGRPSSRSVNASSMLYINYYLTTNRSGLSVASNDPEKDTELSLLRLFVGG